MVTCVQAPGDTPVWRQILQQPEKEAREREEQQRVRAALAFNRRPAGSDPHARVYGYRLLLNKSDVLQSVHCDNVMKDKC